VTPLAWVYIITSLIFAGALPVAQGALMSEKDVKYRAVLANISTSSVAVVILAFFVFAVFGYSPPDSWAAIKWQLLGMTLLYAAANLCLFEAVRYISAALFGLAFTGRVVFVVGASSVILHEALRLLKAVGMLLIVAGVAYATDKRPKGKDKPEEEKLLRGLGFALAGTAFFGVANVVDSSIILTFDRPSYLLFRLFLPMAVVAIVASFRWVKPADVIAYVRPRKRWWPILATSSCIVISSATYMMAYYESRQMGFLSGVHQLSLFVTIGLSAYRNKKERKSSKAYFAAGVVVLIGVYVMYQG